jgi:molybdopterin synthase sulfur carrier subunit
VKVLYFAWLRERLNRGEEDVDPPPEVVTVADLIGWLRSRDEATDAAMQKPELVRAALDTRIVSHQTPLNGAKVVALFPPMTGG